ncbi:hypothetical protein A6A19_01580 [Actinobacillus delphinicola]|uniref:DUF2335 domain-containing protein n=1 Tax=Actinobacillus delphinicola TaxID=51161 RepID=UPI002441F420|nr:DUF2335 domain-containing protein [Actinobacillus delphinicola]MDG6896717.1 hypothetical protein [Actinobacillus delphinicola]
MTILFSHQRISGPLPPTSELQRYNQVIPNGADRIMQLAEKEQENRYAIPKMSLHIQLIGLCFGLISVMLVVGFCCYLVSKEQYGAAVTVMISVLVALAGIFVIGKVIPERHSASQNDKEEN